MKPDVNSCINVIQRTKCNLGYEMYHLQNGQYVGPINILYGMTTKSIKSREDPIACNVRLTRKLEKKTGIPKICFSYNRTILSSLDVFLKFKI